MLDNVKKTLDNPPPLCYALNMKYTNKKNLPQPLVSAVINDDYDKGDADISVTGLLRPPRITVLTERHQDEIEEDVSDRIYSLLGQAVHTILERSDDGSEMSEERLSTVIGGLTVSGKFDRFVLSKGIVQDYKVTTAYKFKDGKASDDFVRQLNIYAYLLREKGYEVKSGEIVGILRDWSKREAQRSPDYPQSQVVIVPVPIFEQKDVLTYLEKRVKMLKEAKVELPECTEEDRWARPSKWAVMEKGKKRAMRLFDSEKEAELRAEKERLKGTKAYVEYRPGENIRCASYCPVADFCDQYKNLK